jgi:hypothetical protein
MDDQLLLKGYQTIDNNGSASKREVPNRDRGRLTEPAATSSFSMRRRWQASILSRTALTSNSRIGHKRGSLKMRAARRTQGMPVSPTSTDMASL